MLEYLKIGSHEFEWLPPDANFSNTLEHAFEEKTDIQGRKTLYRAAQPSHRTLIWTPPNNYVIPIEAALYLQGLSESWTPVTVVESYSDPRAQTTRAGCILLKCGPVGIPGTRAYRGYSLEVRAPV